MPSAASNSQITASAASSSSSAVASVSTELVSKDCPTLLAPVVAASSNSSPELSLGGKRVSADSATLSTAPVIVISSTSSNVRSAELTSAVSAALQDVQVVDSTIEPLNFVDAVPASSDSVTSKNKKTILTPQKIALRKKISLLQSQRWKMRRRLEFLKKANKTAKTIQAPSSDMTEINNVVASAEPFLTKLQLSLFKAQMIGTRRKPKGNRWSVEDKMFCLQFYYKSAVAYRFVSQSLSLPSVSTLRSFVRDAIGNLEPGLNSVLFNILKLRIHELPLCDRQCSLVFDEMSLKSQLTCDKITDKIIGYTDQGTTATHALVFMVRGLSLKWKQAIAYIFTKNTIAASHLSDLIEECVKRLTDVGLYVRCVVCEQGATNVAALKQLGCTVDSPKLKFDYLHHAVHVIFYVPHLLKNVRNNLMKHNIKTDSGVVQWKFIQSVYEIDKKCPIRLLPRLSDRHLEVAAVTKMRVCLAAQILSHSMAAALKMRMITNELPHEATATADFAENMDKLFDLLNSRQLKGNKPARCAITPKNRNLDNLVHLKDWVSKWEFVGARSQSAIKSHSGLQSSISSVLALSRELLQEGFQFVCSSSFNQDCVDNFFAGLRSKHGWNENPTPSQFITAFRNSVVLSSLDSCSSGKNCVSDNDFVLLKHKDLIAGRSASSTSNIAYVVPSAPASVTAQSVCDDEMWEKEQVCAEVLNCDICYEQDVVEVFTEAEESLINYLSGWLACKCGICRDCQDVLSKR